MRVCVCVCVREREREREKVEGESKERERDFRLPSFDVSSFERLCTHKPVSIIPAKICREPLKIEP